MDDLKQIKPGTGSERSQLPVDANTDVKDVTGPEPDIQKIDLEKPQKKLKFPQNIIARLKKKKPLKDSGVSSKISPKTKKILIGVGIFLLVLFILVVIPSIFIFSRAKTLLASSQRLVDAGKAQSIPQIRQSLSETKTSLGKLRNSYKFIVWTKYVPFFGKYVNDGEHVLAAGTYGIEALEILVDTTEPYADILGFEVNVLGEESSGEKTAKERIDFIAKTIPDLMPQLDILSEKVSLVKTEIDEVNPAHYPEKLGGRNVRENVKEIKQLVDLSYRFINEGKPLIESMPFLLGLDTPRNYLILFQNDKELRPTGGFMTAYSIMKVDNATFEPVTSNDIYELDTKYKPAIKAPDPIINYLKGPYILDQRLRLRDMNWSPDFFESMKLFSTEAKTIGVDNIDGIIAVDTQLLVYLLDAIGPIGVPGFGNFSTEIIPECNCPQVIYELESFADIEGPIVWDPISGEIIYSPPNSDNRKRIIGPLMNSIMANSLAQPKEKLPDLFEAVFASLMEKHVLFYVFDKNVQSAVEGFGIGGTIDSFDGDYLHINDANLGGRKSNMYVTQEVVQDIDIAKDGTVTKTLTITYKNPEAHDGWLNSVLPNWVRIYVPEGSELIDISGLEDREDPYTELGKTVFAGYFELRPQGVSKVTVTYKLPFRVGDEYSLFLQKQPGTDAPLYSINIKDDIDEFFLKEDKEVKFSL